MSVIDKKDFTFVANAEKQNEGYHPSLTYWQDAWRRLKKNKLAMIGLILIVLIVLFGVVGPYITGFSYSDQRNDYKNLPPRLSLYVLTDELAVFVSNDYNMFVVDNDGTLTHLEEIENPASTLNRTFTGAVMSPAEKRKAQQEAAAKDESHIKYYTYGDAQIVLDYSNKLIENAEDEYDIIITYGEYTATEMTRTIANKRFPFGTDVLGRDILTRVMYGARISLLVALVATLVNFIIGVLYGAIAGFEGGRTDNIMMRIVDIINSIPLMLYIILLMVLMGNKGIWTIVLAIGTVYWGWHGPPGAWADAVAQGAGICAGCTDAGRIEVQHHPQAPDSKRHGPHYYLHDDDDPHRRVHRKLLKLHRAWRIGANGLVGHAGQQRAAGVINLSLPALLPGGRNRNHDAGVQLPGRRITGCAGSETAERLR